MRHGSMIWLLRYIIYVENENKIMILIVEKKRAEKK